MSGPLGDPATPEDIADAIEYERRRNPEIGFPGVRQIREKYKCAQATALLARRIAVRRETPNPWQVLAVLLGQGSKSEHEFLDYLRKLRDQEDPRELGVIHLRAAMVLLGHEGEHTTHAGSHRFVHINELDRDDLRSLLHRTRGASNFLKALDNLRDSLEIGSTLDQETPRSS